MTEEEIINRLNNLGYAYNLDEKDADAVRKILDLYKKQEKVIDEMAGYINKAYNDEEQFYVGFEKNICEKTKNPQSESSDCYVNIYVDNACEECIKQYIYRKVEEDE